MVTDDNTISALRESIAYLIKEYPNKKNDFHFIVRMIYNSYDKQMSASHSRHIKAFLANDSVPSLNLLLNLFNEEVTKSVRQEGEGQGQTFFYDCGVSPIEN